MLVTKENDTDNLEEEDGGVHGFRFIEKMRKKCRAHRNIVDMEVAFLNLTWFLNT